MSLGNEMHTLFFSRGSKKKIKGLKEFANNNTTDENRDIRGQTRSKGWFYCLKRAATTLASSVLPSGLNLMTS